MSAVGVVLCVSLATNVLFLAGWAMLRFTVRQICKAPTLSGVVEQAMVAAKRAGGDAAAASLFGTTIEIGQGGEVQIWRRADGPRPLSPQNIDGADVLRGFEAEAIVDELRAAGHPGPYADDDGPPSGTRESSP